MYSVPNEVPAADRARWLAELSEALNRAHHVITYLQLSEDDYPAAREVFLRIQAAKLEIQSLRLSRSLNPRDDIDRKWTGSLPW